MQRPEDIHIEDYTYTLPEERIAKYPLKDRSASKLLVYKEGAIQEHRFGLLPKLLPEGAVLVRNNSRVIRARLLFRRASGAQIEVFCLEPAQPQSYELALSSTQACTWHCMLGNARRWKQGEPLVLNIEATAEPLTLHAERGEGDVVHFTWDNPRYTFGEVLEAMGILPIPPYLNRPTEEQDLRSYQTTYAQHSGSVAAPTAGLHFTPELFDELEGKGIPVLDVTLHVGAGTFRPVKSATIGEHQMHQEYVVLSRAFIVRLRELLSRQIIAVGTTSVRTLESLYHLGYFLCKHPDTPYSELHVGQWQAYETQGKEMPTAEACLSAILGYMDSLALETLSFPTAILIAPGYQYRVIKGLITNFHQPHSTLLLLIAALLGKDWRQVYDYALAHSFRFLSYGDSSLLLPKG